MNLLIAALSSTIRTSTPLLLAAMGELVTERAGIINIGLEGSVIAGAFAATVIAPEFGLLPGYLSGAVGGAMLGLVMAVFVVWLRADQIIAGTAVAMLGLGITAALYRVVFGAAGVALTVPTSSAVGIPVLARLPAVGPALFNQPPITYLTFLLVPLLWWYLYRTHAGLALRAIGESPAAARAVGIRVPLIRASALVFGGSMAGVAGAVLVLAQAGTFAEGMSAGRGFMALAIVALGQWRPLGVAGAALLFGLATAVQFIVQAAGWSVRYELVLMLPYALTLVALVLAPRHAAPAMLARPD